MRTDIPLDILPEVLFAPPNGTHYVKGVRPVLCAYVLVIHRRSGHVSRFCAAAHKGPSSAFQIPPSLLIHNLETAYTSMRLEAGS